jgi:SET domain-containing protein
MNACSRLGIGWNPVTRWITLGHVQALPHPRSRRLAWVDLRKGQRIIEYIGPKISKAQGLAERERGNAYLFSFDENYDIDGSVMWNPARFLNHSCAPNCESDIVRDQIWLYAKRRIHAGEELTYNYGFGLGGYEERPCNCGALTCVGFMVDE